MSKIYKVIAKAIKDSTLRNSYSTTEVVDKDGLVKALSASFMQIDALFNLDNFVKECEEEVNEDDETKVVKIEEPKITVSVYWADIPKQDLKKLADMATDVLAHKLNINYDSARFIQDNYLAILKEGK